MRILGLDYGAKTIGVAVSDALGLTAQGVEIIRRERESHLRKSMRRLAELIAEYDVGEIVVGHPVHMDGTVGERAKAAEEFAKALERRVGLPVFLWDERLTTVEAKELLSEMGVYGQEQKSYVDKLAAVLILEDYMEHGKR